MANRRIAPPPGGAGAPLKLVSAVVLFGVSACTTMQHVPRVAPTSSQIRAYAPPGPPGDPWGPYITEASTRFAVPEAWVREVIRQESGGREYIGGYLITSAKGAVGLMQVMPETYAELRTRYGLDADPYHPRNNVLAGTAYIREMYDRFGSPGFLAAYNAGPRRFEDYLHRGVPLPGETVAYVASVAPRLGASSNPSRPLAVYASAAPEISADELNRRSLAGLASQPVPATRMPPPAATYARTAEATSADDLNRRVLEATMPRGGGAAPLPSAPAMLPSPSLAAAEISTDDLNRQALAGIQGTAAAAGGWGVQVGAFSGPMQARAAAENARAQAGNLLNAADVAVAPTVRSDGVILYRARLTGLPTGRADEACRLLTQHGVICVVVTPSPRT